MTYHMGCSRRCGIPHIVKPPNLSENSENSKDIVSSHAASSNGNGNASPTKISISSQYLLPGESVKRRRSRRGRIKDSYAKAIAAFSTIYPKVFSVRDRVCPLVKIEPRTPEEDTELLQELPALISPLKQVDHEVPVQLCKFRHGRDPRSCPQSELPPWSSKVPSGNAEVPPSCESPGFDPLTEDSYVSPDECCDVESFLDSNNGLSDINRGMNGILGGAGDSNSVPDDHPSHACVFGAYGNGDLVDEGAYYSAIGALRRRQWHHDGCRRDYVASGHVAPWRMRLADKIKAEKEMNAMSFCLVDWLKRDDQHRLALKLNYEEVLRAWSDRGSLYIDGQCPQTVPDDDDDEDSVCHSMVSVDLGLVPDLNFWRGGDDNVIQCNYTVEDGSSAVEDGVETKMNTGIREARVLRYKEKRQTRLFSKKIRYEVRKLNAERRPRMKGRFVKRLVDL